MHWGRGQALAHEALLLLRVWNHPRRPALHHEGWTATLLQLLWVPLCRVLWCVWRTHRYSTCFLQISYYCFYQNTWTCFSYINIIQNLKQPFIVVWVLSALWALCATAVERRSQCSEMWMVIIIPSSSNSERACFRGCSHVVSRWELWRWLPPLAGKQGWWNVFALPYDSSDHDGHKITNVFLKEKKCCLYRESLIWQKWAQPTG